LYSLIGDTMAPNPNIYAAGLLDGYLAAARVDNSIAYRGTFGGLTVGTTYSFGRDAVASAPAGGCAGESSSDSHACRDISGAIQYTTADWGVAMGFDRMYGGAGAGSPLPASSQTDTRSTISGFAKVGGGTIGAGLVHRKNDGSPTPDSDYWFVGGNYPIGRVLLDLQYGRLNVKDSPNDASVIAARATYSFSTRTAVYFTVGRLQNEGNATFSVDGGVPTGSAPLPGVGQSGVMVGLRHAF
jgi:predicted porin